MRSTTEPPSGHVPVLTEAVLAALAPLDGATFLDGTVGLGGHAAALLAASDSVNVVGLDIDEEALEHARRRLAPYADRVRLLHGSYADLRMHLGSLGYETVDGILLDLGVSSLQLDDPSRGFSFRGDAPLDMRMDPSRGATAAEWLDDVSEEELVRVLQAFGEERYARRIAHAIISSRRRVAIRSTADLVAIVHRAVPGSYFRQRIDPATRTFQALRIAVNRELENLERGLEESFACLAVGGRLAVISFHSLEDRQVKRFMQARAAPCTCPPGLPECLCGKAVEAEILTRKPIVPSAAESSRNPRARSAKLRVCRKVAEFSP